MKQGIRSSQEQFRRADGTARLKARAKSVAISAAEFTFFLSIPLALMSAFWVVLNDKRESILAFLLR